MLKGDGKVTKVVLIFRERINELISKIIKADESFTKKPVFMMIRKLII